METQNLTAAEIAEKIIAGERLKSTDDLKFFFETSLEELQQGAGLIQKKYRGNCNKHFNRIEEFVAMHDK